MKPRLVIAAACFLPLVGCTQSSQDRGFGGVRDCVYCQGLEAPFIVELFIVGFFVPSPSVVICLAPPVT